MGKHNRKQSFVQAFIEEADELEKELNNPETTALQAIDNTIDKLEKELNNPETTTAEDEGPEQELDFDRHDFGTITEDEE